MRIPRRETAAPARIAPRPRVAADGAILSKAVVRAAGLLAMSQREVARTLGVSESTASRLFAGKFLLSSERAKEWEFALLFVRLFRSLDALWGHDATARTWLRSENLGLGARPIELMASVEGLVRVVAFLDSARGRI